MMQKISHSFQVADVVPAKLSLESTTLRESLSTHLQQRPEATGCNAAHLIASSGHALVSAVHQSFDQHLPLILSPDDIWLAIGQGFAQHVNAHSESLRHHFVSHQGRAEIVVIRDHFRKGSPDNDWAGALSEFSDQIAVHIGRKRDFIVSDFSTTGAIERTASDIVLMNAMQSYFDYTLLTRCGIPTITLLGTADDWEKIRRKASVLGEFGLEWWLEGLLPVLNQFVATSHGRVDREFWQSFFKLDGGSGGPYVTGWINVFLPYVHDRKTDAVVRLNPYAQKWNERITYGGGSTVVSIPSGLSMAPFLWKYLGQDIEMQLFAGFVGVSQDIESSALRPAIGWAVCEAPRTRQK